MNEDARIEAAIEAYRIAWDHATYGAGDEDAMKDVERACMAAALAAAIPPGSVVVSADDLRTVMMWAMTAREWMPGGKDQPALDRLRAKIGEAS